MKRHWLWAGAVCLLAGCSGLLGTPAVPEQVYRLAPAVQVRPSPQPLTLLVPALTVHPALDSPRITLYKPGLQQDFVAHSRWPAALSRYLHAVVVESLARSNAFQGVVGQPLPQVNYRLLLRVDAFQIDYPAQGEGTATAVVTVDATLLAGQNQRVVWQQRHTARQAGLPLRTGALVAGLDRALAQVLEQLVQDVLATVRGDSATGVSLPIPAQSGIMESVCKV